MFHPVNRTLRMEYKEEYETETTSELMRFQQEVSHEQKP